MKKTTSKALRLLPFLMWGYAVLFYLYQYIIRVSPGVMRDEIMLAFHLNASGFGTLAALAMYSYGIFQIPTGLLVDRYGARRIILASIVICVLGVLCFSLATSVTVAAIGRILIGLGSACGFLSVNKVGAAWFPPERRAIVFGMTMTAGTIGALNGGAPLAIMMESYGWRWCLLALAAVGAIVFFVNFFFLKEKSVESALQEDRASVSFSSILRRALSSRIVLLSALAATGIYLCISVIADLWGVDYLMQRYGVSKTSAAQGTSLIYIGLCVGSLLISWVSDRLGLRKLFIVAGSLGITLCVAFLLYMPVTFEVASLLLFLIGFLSGAEMVCFALATEVMPFYMAATIIGVINATTTVGGAMVQQSVGHVLDCLWSGACDAQGLRCYSEGNYQTALSLLFIFLAVITVSTFFLPKSNFERKSS